MQYGIDPSQAVIEVAAQSAPTISPVAGFWRRLAAWLVDTLILGLIGQLISLVLGTYLFQIGPYGRPLGLLLILPYFGVANSKIGGGQTIGKRLMKIAVRDESNSPIGLARSLGRTTLIALPALFNGWALPIFEGPILSWFVSLLVFGLGGSIVYTMVFNRKARQGIHDLLAGTYVVNLAGKPIASLPKSAQIHKVVVGAWMGIIGVATVLMAFLVPSLTASKPMASVMDVYHALQSDGRFFSASVLDSVSFVSNSGSSHSLVVSVWYKGNPGSDEQRAIVDSIVRTVFEHSTNLDTYDSIRVGLTSAYDIGVASGSFTVTSVKAVDEWRQELGIERP